MLLKYLLFSFFLVIRLLAQQAQEKQPEPTLPLIEILAPKPSTPTKGPLLVEARIQDAGGIATVEFMLAGHPQKEPTAWQEQDRWFCRWENLEDGLYRVVVTAIDKQGRKITQSIDTQWDTSAPIVEWLKPRDSVVAEKAISLEVEILDDSSIEKVLLHLEKEAEVFRFQRKDKIWALDFIPPREGKHTMMVSAQDTAGNIGLGSPISFFYHPFLVNPSFPKASEIERKIERAFSTHASRESVENSDYCEIEPLPYSLADGMMILYGVVLLWWVWKGKGE